MYIQSYLFTWCATTKHFGFRVVLMSIIYPTLNRSPPVTRKSMPINGATGSNNTGPSSLGHGTMLSPPMRGRSRSRSPASTRRAQMMNHNDSGPSSLDASFSFRRSVSPSKVRFAATPSTLSPKKITINEPTMNSMLTVTSMVDEIIPEITPAPIQATATAPPNNSSNADAAGKFENISDNGSEISDEGYRSLGLIQNGGGAQNGHGGAVDKRTSIHSQLSTDDADYSGEYGFVMVFRGMVVVNN